MESANCWYKAPPILCIMRSTFSWDVAHAENLGLGSNPQQHKNSFRVKINLPVKIPKVTMTKYTLVANDDTTKLANEMAAPIAMVTRQPNLSISRLVSGPEIKRKMSMILCILKRH